MRGRFARDRRLSDGTYVELVRSLFSTRAPATIMGILFVVVATVVVRRTPDAMLVFLGWIGGAVSLVRVGMLVAYERRVRDPHLDPAVADRTESLFGAVYLSFAALLGLFGMRVFEVSDIEMHVIVGPLIVGYSAEVATGVSSRPWISIPAVSLAVVPLVLAAMLRGDEAHVLLGFVLAALLLGGIGSMVVRYRAQTDKIAMRHLFYSLARQDPLTGLGNRLALAEVFTREVEEHGVAGVAVHCLDLDRFKPINDDYGHPTGDLLLKEVGARLRSLSRARDVAARLGGDEFVLLQTGVGHADHAALMARRIVRVLSEPYVIEGRKIEVGVSVGYALPSSCSGQLADLLHCADRALYRIKRSGGGSAVAHDRAESDRPLAASA